MSRKALQQAWKSQQQEQEAGWPQWIPIQGADGKQEMGPGYETSNPTPVTYFFLQGSHSRLHSLPKHHQPGARCPNT